MSENSLPNNKPEERVASASVTAAPDPVPLHTLDVPGVDHLRLLRDEFARLKDKYGLGQYKTVRDDLLKFIAGLEGCNSSLIQHNEIEVGLMLAESYALLGRAYDRLSLEPSARSAWSHAVDLFEKWLRRAEERNGTNQGHPDYGVALYNIGRKEDAFNILRSFEEGESGRYHGICLMERGRSAEAETLFRRLLNRNPEDAFTHKSLGKSLQALGKMEEAAEEYLLAGYYMLRLNIFDESEATLRRALHVNCNPEIRVKVLPLLAQALHNLNRDDEALSTLEHSFDLISNDVFALGTLSQMLRLRGKNEKAVEILRRIIEIDPSLGRAYIELGAALIDQRKFEEALEAINRADVLLPNDSNILYLRGAVLAAHGRKDEAVESLKLSVAANPTFTEGYKALTSLLCEANRFTDALDLLRAADGKAPEIAPTLSMFRSRVYLNMGDKEAALREADASLSVDKNNALALAYKGCALHRLKRDEEAVTSLQEALALDPKINWAYVELAETFLCLNRIDEAWLAVDNALNESDENPAAHELKGRLLRIEFKIEAAEEALRYALKLDERLSTARAELYFVIRDNEAALTAVEKVLERNPLDAWWLGLKGSVLRRLGRIKEAVATLRRSIEENRRLAWLHNELGKALSIFGDNEAALEAFDRSLALRPNQPDALASKGEVLRVEAGARAAKGDVQSAKDYLEKALQTLDKSLTFKPDNPWALGIKGQILTDQQRYDQAIPVLQRALELDTGIAWIHVILGAAFYSTEKYLEALAALDKALKLQFHTDWAIFTAQLRCDIADFHIAVDLLDSVLEIEEENINALWMKGWALQNLVPERAPELLGTYQTAIRIDEGKTLALQVGLADALYLNDRMEEAQVQYLKIIERAQTEGERDRNTLSIIGWCCLRAGRYDEAIKSFLNALTISPDVIADQFNLALAMIHKNYESASREYQRGLHLVRRKTPLRRRGLVYVALDDLRAALRANPELGEASAVKEILLLLETTFDELDSVYRNMVAESMSATV